MNDQLQTRGQRIAVARNQIGWSQSDLARYLECTQAQISYAENDRENVATVYWMAFADFCHKVQIGFIRKGDKPDSEALKRTKA